jgi:hypothetical protein
MVLAVIRQPEDRGPVVVVERLDVVATEVDVEREPVLPAELELADLRVVERGSEAGSPASASMSA